MSEGLKLVPYKQQDLIWDDIRGLEEWREYDYGDGRKYRIERPVSVNIQRSAKGDSHRLIDDAGVSHYVGRNWVAFSFGGEWGLLPPVLGNSYKPGEKTPDIFDHDLFNIKEYPSFTAAEGEEVRVVNAEPHGEPRI